MRVYMRLTTPCIPPSKSSPLPRISRELFVSSSILVCSSFFTFSTSKYTAHRDETRLDPVAASTWNWTHYESYDREEHPLSSTLSSGGAYTAVTSRLKLSSRFTVTWQTAEAGRKGRRFPHATSPSHFLCASVSSTWSNGPARSLHPVGSFPPSSALLHGPLTSSNQLTFILLPSLPFQLPQPANVSRNEVHLMISPGQPNLLTSPSHDMSLHCGSDARRSVSPSLGLWSWRTL